MNWTIVSVVWKKEKRFDWISFVFFWSLSFIWSCCWSTFDEQLYCCLVLFFLYFSVFRVVSFPLSLFHNTIQHSSSLAFCTVVTSAAFPLICSSQNLQLILPKQKGSSVNNKLTSLFHQSKQQYYTTHFTKHQKRDISRHKEHKINGHNIQTRRGIQNTTNIHTQQLKTHSTINKQ